MSPREVDVRRGLTGAYLSFSSEEKSNLYHDRDNFFSTKLQQQQKFIFFPHFYVFMGSVGFLFLPMGEGMRAMFGVKWGR